MGTCQPSCCNKDQEVGLRTHLKSEINVDDGNPDIEDVQPKESHHSQIKQRDKFEEDRLHE